MNNHKTIYQPLQSYLEKFDIHFSYVKVEENSRDIEPVFNSTVYYFINEETQQQLTFKIVVYTDKTIVFLRLYKKGTEGLYSGGLSFFDYFSKLKNIEEPNSKFILDNYNGLDTNEKLSNFFEWLTSVTDTQLINILQGQDWVDIPFDWGGYR